MTSEMRVKDLGYFRGLLGQRPRQMTLPVVRYDTARSRSFLLTLKTVATGIDPFIRPWTDVNLPEHSTGPETGCRAGCLKWLLIGLAAAAALLVIGVIGLMGVFWYLQKTTPYGLSPDPPADEGSVPQRTSDGESVLVASDGRILRIRPDAGGIETVLQQSDGGYGLPSVSRTGRMAYLEYKEKTDWVYSGPYRRSVETSDKDGGGTRRLQRVRFAVAPAMSPDGSRVAYDEYEPSD